jgi:DNA (cytosine-5)-methyltransferase 1
VAGHVLRELIKAQVIPPGEVDERSIEEVQPDDTRGFRHCHFFAGGGGWAIAAQMASWPEEKPLWTGSPPCQSFSKAGTRRGRDDPRHLWPHYYRLVRTIRPSVIAFEQVSSKAGYAWLDGVRDNLRGSGYAVEAFDIAAAAVGAPQILQRLYGIGLLAHPESLIGGASSLRDIANREAGGERPEPNPCDDFLKFRGASLSEQFWREAELRKGQNGEFRRVKPGLRLLAHGLPGRVDANRLVGNSIVPPLAAQVLAAVLDVLRDGTGDQHSS